MGYMKSTFLMVSVQDLVLEFFRERWTLVPVGAPGKHVLHVVEYVLGANGGLRIYGVGRWVEIYCMSCVDKIPHIAGSLEEKYGLDRYILLSGRTLTDPSLLSKVEELAENHWDCSGYEGS